MLGGARHSTTNSALLLNVSEPEVDTSVHGCLDWGDQCVAEQVRRSAFVLRSLGVVTGGLLTSTTRTTSLPAYVLCLLTKLELPHGGSLQALLCRNELSRVACAAFVKL